MSALTTLLVSLLTGPGAVLGDFFASLVAPVDPDTEEAQHQPDDGTNYHDERGDEPRLVDER